MNDLPKIGYLNLDIFCYDYREGLGQRPEELEANRSHFLNRLADAPLTSQQTQELREREQSNNRFMPLLTAPYVQPLREPIDGYFYPVKLGDSYGLQINCAGYRNWQNRACTPEDLKEIYRLLAERHRTPGQLGETWLVWGKLAEECREEDLSKLAIELMRSLGRTVDSSWNKEGENQCFWQGATLFEFSELPGQAHSIHQQKPQVLICLFPHNVPDETVVQLVTTELYPNLMELCYYRSKILWIYGETRKIKQSLKAQAPEVRSIVTATQSSSLTLANTLDRLQENLEGGLTTYQKYAQWISYLEEYRYALQVNCDNYEKRFLRLLKSDAPQGGSFFLDFHDYITEQFIPQVTNDYNTLFASLKLIDNQLKTTEGQIRLEQTRVESVQGERDRNIENLIGAASVGLGVSSTAASAWAGQIPKPLYVFGFSLGLGIISAILTYAIARWIRR
ncbi:hypothetical protein [Oscillatoria sp. FACHB-1406]|uniref:hypothetical protein n=1 Tax=Oscillatoria sp. FACHB-1406 TaxID=2692846 RepID=UPI001681E385|nr:hypothetical protein [Oscillatoria sp. FACHB-1406]MBD2576738.1 hypothetical protein [Oscillatoria sp. FACHB-1406]